jgi:tetratricopeptide (TPR) repeat protein
MRILVGTALLLVTLGLRAAQPSALLPQSAKTAGPDQQLAAAEQKHDEAMAHYMEGLRLEDDGRMREALGHYLKALQGTGNAGLTEHVAQLAADYGSLDEGLKLLESAAKAPNATAETYAAYTRFCATHSVEHPELASTAEKVSEEALTRFPRDPVAYDNAARFQLAAGNRAKAEQVMEQALKQTSSDPQYWLDTGRVAQEVWPLADSDKHAEHLRKINAFFEKAEKLAQDSAIEPASLVVADYYLFSNQLDHSAAICDRLVKRSGSYDARKRLWRLYEAMEKPDDSLKALEDLVKAFPNDVEHRELLAKNYVEKRDYDKALVQYQAALQAGGGALQDYLRICILLHDLKQPDKYLQFTQRTVQLFPGEPRALYHEALAQNQNKNYVESARLFEEAEKLAQTRAPDLLSDGFHFVHGVALERSGRYDDAAIQFEKSIQLTPNDDPHRAASAMNYLGYMWLERGEHLDKAEELIRKANEYEPDNAAYMDSLGWLHFKTGKVEQALTELLDAEKKLKEVEPDDAEILDHIAQAYEKSGQRSKAEEYWRRVVNLKPPDEKLLKRAEKELGIKKPEASPPKGEPASPALQ